MLLSVLVSLVACAPAASAAPPAPVAGAVQGSQGAAARRAQGRLPRAGVFGEALPGGGSLDQVLGGSWLNRGGGSSVAPTGRPGIYHITFSDTGTIWQEPFLLGIPEYPLAPAPLLVMFHSYGHTEWDCYYNTGLMKRALERGWYVVAPRGAHQYNFGIPYSQTNTEFVLDWVTTVFSVDPNRVYGVGFSMGGGGVTSYAARHLDAAHARFAAVVNHTGGVSVANTYWNSLDTSIFDDPLMFGGSPALYPFKYSQVSAIDLDPSTLTVDPDTDMARNLKHVPFETWYAVGDPIAYLLQQSDAFHAWLSAIPGISSLVQVQAFEHTWATLDEVAVLDFLASKRLRLPSFGTHRLMADRDGRWMHFTIEQDYPDVLTPFRWNSDPSLNRFILDSTQNLRHLRVGARTIGLDTSANLTVIPGTQDGLPEEIEIQGYVTIPSQVYRNGLPTTDWAWDPQMKSVTLFESSAAGYPQWRIEP